MSWSKANRRRRTCSASVTLSTAQSPMSWSKAEARMNIRSRIVTPEVSHAPMSSLKDARGCNRVAVRTPTSSA